MDTLTTEQRSERMGRVRNKDTKPELVVRRLVHATGYRYRLHGKNVPGHPDMVFAGKRKVIFIHCCFWHHHENCKLASTPKSRVEFWLGKFEENVRRDDTVRQELEAGGWNWMVVWQCEVKDVKRLEERIRGFLENE